MASRTGFCTGRAQMEPVSTTSSTSASLLPLGYSLWTECPIVLGGSIAAWSTDEVDPVWDDFLVRHPHGQFQQGTAWARTKSDGGWMVARVGWFDRERLVGGFQILHRSTRVGRIGYVTKGPVIEEETAAASGIAVGQLLAAARRLRLLALVVQAPDESQQLSPALRAGGFDPERLMRVNERSLIIDLRPGLEAVQQGMRARTRAEVRQARRRGVTIEEGSEADLPVFFELMLSSCRRQNARPNPGSLRALTALHGAYQGQRQTRLTFARANGGLLGGGLCIQFGRRVTFWKKGWSTAGRGLHPMALVNWDCIEWSVRNGYDEFDFAAMAPDVAETLLSGGELSAEQRQTRDYFNLGFGGRPCRLAPALIYFPGRAARLVWRVMNWGSSFRGLAGKLARAG